MQTWALWTLKIKSIKKFSLARQIKVGFIWAWSCSNMHQCRCSSASSSKKRICSHFSRFIVLSYSALAVLNDIPLHGCTDSSLSPPLHPSVHETWTLLSGQKTGGLSGQTRPRTEVYAHPSAPFPHSKEKKALKRWQHGSAKFNARTTVQACSVTK